MTATPIGAAPPREATLSYSTAFKTPSWTRVARVNGHKLPVGRKTGKSDGRDLAAQEAVPAELTVGPLTFQYRHLRGATDAVLTALEGSKNAGTNLLWLEADDVPGNTGCVGWKFPGWVRQINKTAEDPGAVVYDVEVVYREAYDEDGTLVELAAYSS